MLVKVHSWWFGLVYSVLNVRSGLQRGNGPARFAAFGWSGPSDN